MRRLPIKATSAAILLFVALVFAAHSLAFRPVDSAITCVEDWQAIVHVIEDRGTEHSGVCAFFGTPQPYDAVPPDILEELARAELEMTDLLDDWQSSRATETAVGLVGGLPLVVFALFIGILASAPELKEGTLAWLLSNGHTRRRFMLQTWAWVALLALLLLLLGVLAEILLVSSSIDGRAGLTFEWPSPSSVFDVIRPVPGAFMYVAIGMALGFAIASVDVAVVVGTVAVGFDAFILADSSFGVWSPAGAHAVLLRAGDLTGVASWPAFAGNPSVLAEVGVTLLWAVVALAITVIVLRSPRVQMRPARAG
jgi:hypothetical protein